MVVAGMNKQWGNVFPIRLRNIKLNIKILEAIDTAVSLRGRLVPELIC
jgi:hypothetical protein